MKYNGVILIIKNEMSFLFDCKELVIVDIVGAGMF